MTEAAPGNVIPLGYLAMDRETGTCRTAHRRVLHQPARRRGYLIGVRSDGAKVERTCNSGPAELGPGAERSFRAVAIEQLRRTDSNARDRCSVADLMSVVLQ